ncbi:MAG: efflux RND transporter periplasmic adaptor subunit [Fimbriimonadaceae bacterium]|nr:efflux RND transporter periplasmic adaptor subunit [Fimbriimonadaceae bacterium]
MKLSWFLIPLTLFAITGCVDREAQEQGRKTEAALADPVIDVTTHKAVAQDVQVSIPVTGQIETGRDAQVGASVTGRITAVFVREGQKVSAGQIVAQQETADSRARLSQAQAQAASARSALQQALTNARTAPAISAAGVRAAEAQLAQAKANLEKAQNGARSEERAQAEINVRRAKSDLDTAEAARERARRLYDEGAIALATYEQAENRYQNALAAYDVAVEQLDITADAVRPEDIRALEQGVRAAEENVKVQRANQQRDSLANEQVEAARANVRAADESVNLARKALNDASIRAPFSGRVLGTPLAIGTVVAPGTPIMRLVTNDGAFFRAEVPETKIADVPLGAPVTVTIDAVRGVQLEGRVDALEPRADSVGRLFGVRISLAQLPNRVQVGMFARGTINAESRTGVVMIPVSAVIRSGDSVHVFVVEEGVARKRTVTLGYREGDLVEAIGLRSGDEVVLKGKTIIVDGTRVSVNNPEEGDAKSEPSPTAAEPGA